MRELRRTRTTSLLLGGLVLQGMRDHHLDKEELESRRRQPDLLALLTPVRRIDNPVPRGDPGQWKIAMENE